MDLRIRLYEDLAANADFGKSLVANDELFAHQVDFGHRGRRKSGAAFAAAVDSSQYWLLRHSVSDAGVLSLAHAEKSIELLYCKVPEVAKRQVRSVEQKFWKEQIAHNQVVRFLVVLALALPTLLNVVGILVSAGLLLAMLSTSVLIAVVLLPVAILAFVISGYAKSRLARMKLTSEIFAGGNQTMLSGLWPTSSH